MALSKRANGRIKLYSFDAGKLPHTSLYRGVGGKGLHLHFDRDRESPAHAEGLGGDLEDRCGLLALVLGALDEPYGLPDEVERESVLGSDALRGLIALDVGFDNWV
jgi:hypothetical protein